jgi:hypothetical protein
MCCGDNNLRKERPERFNFNLSFQGVANDGTNLAKVGTNTNGDFQVILPNNVPTGRYAISVRHFQIYGANEDASGKATFVFKLFLDTLPMVGGYNNSNQSNNSLYGIFRAEPFLYANPDIYGYLLNYEGGYHPQTCQVSGIASLANGTMRIRITNQVDSPISIRNQANLNGNWFLSLNFEYLGE